MENINFIAVYGTDQLDARIQQYWVGTYYLFIDNMLHGQILFREGVWSFVPNKDEHVIYGDDLMVLAEMIEAAK